MYKYYAVYEHNKGMQIDRVKKELLNYAELRYNEYKGVKTFNSLNDVIKNLDGYSKPVKIIFTGGTIIPQAINYPKLFNNPFKKVIFPL